MRVEESVIIACPLEAAFALAGDFANDARWSGAVKESVQISAGPLGVGARFRHLTEFMGQRIDATGVLTEYEPPSRSCYRSESGPIPHRDCRDFAATAEGTRLTIVLEAELSGVYRMAEPMIRGAGQQQLRADLQRLRRLLESAASPAP